MSINPILLMKHVQNKNRKSTLKNSWADFNIANCAIEEIHQIVKSNNLLRKANRFHITQWSSNIDNIPGLRNY